MEKLQGPINPIPCQLLEEQLEVGCLEEENGGLGMMSMSYGQFLSSLEDPYILPSLEDKMPFLQMLQGFEKDNQHQEQQEQQQPPSFPLMQDPNNFQLLLRLQHQKLVTRKPLMEPPQNQSCFSSCYELESCVTNNNLDLHSPVKSQNGEEFGPKCNEQPVIQRPTVGRSKPKVVASSPMVGATKERRKRKRSTRPSKNKEEVESQRMTHIAVERNRRRQMNEHLNALRSLMPPSYIQRGDQASIIGGAIDFVKEMEQLLQSLQAQKRMRQSEENGDVSGSSSTSSSSNLLGNNLFMPPPPPKSSNSSSPMHFRYSHSHEEGNGNGIRNGNGNEEYIVENRSAIADIEVVVIQNHVNLKIQCQRRAGQLLKAIVALDQLRLSVLHLNITSLHSFVHYSFNLKIEEECKLGSADEVANAVHQIFSLINMS